MSASYDPTKINVAIVGGGIGGLCTAIGLLKNPHLNVHIYEAAPKFSEIGAGVGFGPNAVRALKLIGPETEQAFHRVVTGNIWRSHKNTWYDFYYGEGELSGQFISALKNSLGQQSLHRAKFLDELAKHVPGTISHFGKRLEKMEEPEKEGEALTLMFRDGTTAMADCVLGFDGIHSATRQNIFGDRYPLRFSGNVAWRGLIPMIKARAALGDELAENSFMYMGYGKVIISVPIDGGETINIVAVDTTLKSWEGPWVVTADKEELQRTFSSWDETPKTVIQLLVDLPKLEAWAIWDLTPLDSYTATGRTVALLGDAAHATTPFQGQGAGQAIEDAYVIQALLEKVTEKSQIPSALSAYDIIRRPRSQKVGSTSDEAMELLSLRQAGVGDDLNKLKEQLDWRMDWIWNRDIEGEARDSILVFEELLHPQTGR